MTKIPDYLVLSEYDKMFLKSVSELGGFENAHTHLDRTSTLNQNYLHSAGIDPIEGASLPLRVKQNLMGEMHKGVAYSRKDLKKRIKTNLEDQVKMMTKQVTSFIDATPDLSENGLIAINVANELKKEMANDIDFRIAVSPIFGFKHEDRWQVYKEAAKKSDTLGGLPEKDEPIKEGRIGFKEHIKRVLLLGQELRKEVHFQLDQSNDPRENGTEILIEAVKWLGSPEIENQTTPTVWAVHSISPSCYDDERFYKMVDGLLEYNIGIICCPSAALSMRQLRPTKTPTHNSIARILEMLEAGVQVKIGSDNICDVFVPSGDGNILTEIKILSNALRFYIVNVLAKMSTGNILNEMDKEMIRRSLAVDKDIFREIEEN